MNPPTEGFNCNEYLDEYYASGLFHSTECRELYAHKNMSIDEDKSFLRISEIYDDQDLILGYRKNENGIWGHYNRNYDGTFMYVSDSLKVLCEGWYPGNPAYWREMAPEKQWNEISNYYEQNMERYQWKGEKIKEFIDNCIRTQQLTEFYIKAYRTTVAITQNNSFALRSITNLVHVTFDYEQGIYKVDFKNDFFDYLPKSKVYEDISTEAIKDIGQWIKNSALGGVFQIAGIVIR